MDPEKTAYSYIRFSTLSQETGDSVRRQSKESLGALQWCKNSGYTLSDQVFVDKGKSGFKGTNIKEGGELKRFIDLVDSGEIAKGSCLIIDEYSRFSRMPPVASLEFFLSVVNRGIGLAFLGSYEKRVINTVLLNKEPYLLNYILGEINRSYTESAEKGRRVTQSALAKLSKMRAGEILKHHNAPRYYTYNNTKKTYEQNDLTPVVKRIITEFLAGKSLYNISGKLNRDGIRSIRYHQKQSNWSRMAVKSLLESKCLYGEFLEIPNYFREPLITKSEWNEIQVKLIRNKSNHGRYSSEYVNIFRGVAFCSACRRPMILGCQKKNSKSGTLKNIPYRYIRCSSRSNGMPCDNNHQLNLHELEASFFCEFIDKSPAEAFDATKKIEFENLNKELNEKLLQLTTLDNRLSNLIKMAGTWHEDKLLKECKLLKSEKILLTKQIDQINITKSSFSVQRKVRVPMITEISWDSDEAIENVIKYADYTKSEVLENLENNQLRIKIREELPNIIGRININTNEKTYSVINRSGQTVFNSEPVDKERIWEKVTIASHKPEHVLAIKGKTPQQIVLYYNKMADNFRSEEKARNKRRASIPASCQK